MSILDALLDLVIYPASVREQMRRDALRREWMANEIEREWQRDMRARGCVGLGLVDQVEWLYDIVKQRKREEGGR